tara:strand:+ start:366 stop:527 length:162 start_codon:yes stop_codon:yes gene_type:complete
MEQIPGMHRWARKVIANSVKHFLIPDVSNVFGGLRENFFLRQSDEANGASYGE